MAPGKIFLELSVAAVLFLILTVAGATRAHQSGILSLLTNKLQHHDKPVIIILGKDVGLKKDRAHLDEGALETSVEDGSLQLVHQLLVQDVQPQHKLKKSTLKPYNRDERKRKPIRNQKNVLQKEDKTLRSPIVKKLLRISNSLRCEAKDECQDKCASKFYGKKVTNCVIQCETKYECDEEQEKDKEDDDPCDDDEDNDCDDDRKNGWMSTKGERLVTETSVNGVK